MIYLISCLVTFECASFLLCKSDALGQICPLCNENGGEASIITHVLISFCENNKIFGLQINDKTKDICDITSKAFNKYNITAAVA